MSTGAQGHCDNPALEIADLPREESANSAKGQWVNIWASQTKRLFSSAREQKQPRTIGK